MGDVDRREALRLLALGREELRSGLDAARWSGLLESHATGDAWSAVDLAGHVAGWERLALDLIDDVRAGADLRVDVVLSGPGAVDRYNAEVVAANRALPVAEVLAGAEQTGRDLTAAIESLSDDEWGILVPSRLGPDRPPAILGAALGTLLGAPDAPFEHVSAHRSDIEGLRRARG